jgi:FkbM family methyltransferase
LRLARIDAMSAVPAAPHRRATRGGMNEPAPFGSYAPSGLAGWIIARTQKLPNNWLGRRLYVLSTHFLRREPLDVERLGARMRLYPHKNICDKKVLFTPQLFDPDELALLKARVRDGFTFVDIGANIGAYSLFVAALAGPAARILAVEPQPDVFDRLTYNIRQNPFGTVKAVACAVADKAGELTMFLDRKNQGESSVKIVAARQDGTIRVPATTLLNLVRQEGFSRIDAIKLDVEGAEDIILEPFFRDAPEALHPGLVIIEKDGGQWQIDLPALLAGHGYGKLAETRLNLVFERKPRDG